jgi:uncharacterized protein
MRHKLQTTLLICALLLWEHARAQSPVNPDDAAWKSGEMQWREQRAQTLAGPAPSGYLSLVGSDWLSPGNTSVGSTHDNQIVINGAPAHLGVVRLEDNTVWLIAPPGGLPRGLSINGKPAVAGELGLYFDVQPPGAPPPSEMRYGPLTLGVSSDNGQYSLFVFDTRAAARKEFQGLHWYPPDHRYAVAARWLPYPEPVARTITTQLGMRHEIQVPGFVLFSWQGQLYAIEPSELEDAGMMFSLHDPTNSTTTYGGGRFLLLPYPEHGVRQPAELTLDFNRLRNPPCAYTPYTNCPLAPEQNRFPLPLPVGELRYHP